MKLLTSIFLLTLIADSSYAASKAKITLNEDSMSSTGGSSRPVEITIKFSKGFFSDDPIPNEEKIKAMKMEIAYYQFLDTYKIDLSKKITAKYTKKKLATVIKELLPKVNVKFDGVDPQVMVESFDITEAKLKTVLKYLDRASGVYLTYSKDGILVTSKPN